MIVWLSCLHMHCQSTETDTHTHRERESESESSMGLFDEKGTDKQGSLLTGAEKCASGVDSEVAARTGNDVSRRVCLRCVPGCQRARFLCTVFSDSRFKMSNKKGLSVQRPLVWWSSSKHFYISAAAARCSSASAKGRTSIILLKSLVLGKWVPVIFCAV